MVKPTASVSMTPSLVINLKLTTISGDEKKIKITEGCKLTNLRYLEGGKEIVASGSCKVIKYNHVDLPNSSKDCVHDTVSKFRMQFIPNSLIIDCSKEYASDIREIGILAIRDCDLVEYPDEETEPEVDDLELDIVKTTLFIENGKLVATNVEFNEDFDRNAFMKKFDDLTFEISIDSDLYSLDTSFTSKQIDHFMISRNMITFPVISDSKFEAKMVHSMARVTESVETGSFTIKLGDEEICRYAIAPEDLMFTDNQTVTLLTRFDYDKKEVTIDITSSEIDLEKCQISLRTSKMGYILNHTVEASDDGAAKCKIYNFPVDLLDETGNKIVLLSSSFTEYESEEFDAPKPILETEVDPIAGFNTIEPLMASRKDNEPSPARILIGKGFKKVPAIKVNGVTYTENDLIGNDINTIEDEGFSVKSTVENIVTVDDENLYIELPVLLKAAIESTDGTVIVTVGEEELTMNIDKGDVIDIDTVAVYDDMGYEATVEKTDNGFTMTRDAELVLPVVYLDSEVPIPISTVIIKETEEMLRVSYATDTGTDGFVMFNNELYIGEGEHTEDATIIVPGVGYTKIVAKYIDKEPEPLRVTNFAIAGTMTKDGDVHDPEITFTVNKTLTAQEIGDMTLRVYNTIINDKISEMTAVSNIIVDENDVVITLPENSVLNLANITTGTVATLMTPENDITIIDAVNAPIYHIPTVSSISLTGTPDEATGQMTDGVLTVRFDRPVYDKNATITITNLGITNKDFEISGLTATISTGFANLKYAQTGEVAGTITCYSDEVILFTMEKATDFDEWTAPELQKVQITGSYSSENRVVTNPTITANLSKIIDTNGLKLAIHNPDTMDDVHIKEYPLDGVTIDEETLSFTINDDSELNLETATNSLDGIIFKGDIKVCEYNMTKNTEYPWD